MTPASKHDVDRRADVHAYLADLLTGQLRRYAKRLKVCQNEFSEKAVHDLRVAIRRLMSTVDLLSAVRPARPVKKARRELKDQLNAFDELRDTQVQLLRLAARPSPGRAARRFHAFLAKRERDSVRATHKAVRRWKSRRLTKMIGDFEGELREPRPARSARKDFAVLVRRANEVLTHFGTLREQIDPADTDTIHRTRIAFKRFRYAVEALAPLLPEVTKRRRRALHAYQDRMGAIQDATVLLRSAAEFARKKLDAETARRFLAELEGERHRLISRYLRVADQWHEFGPLRATAPPSRVSSAEPI